VAPTDDPDPPDGSVLVPESGLSTTAIDAIAAARLRVERARQARDVEGVIGSSKDLAETIAKVVLDSLGASYGSDTPVAKLTAMTLKTLGVGTERPALQRLGGSMISAAGAIAELRNSDGTGHGRSAPSALSIHHAEFARSATEAWCTWVLAQVEARLSDTRRYDTVLADIGSDRVFRRGELKGYLGEIPLDEAPRDVQRKIGLSVARRWTMNQTFMPRMDVIDPLAEGTEDFPVAFQDGLIEGLLLDSSGRLRMKVDDARKAVEIAMRLRPRQRQVTLAELAGHVEEAGPAPVFDHDAQKALAELFHDLAGDNQARDPERSLARIAARLDALAQESQPEG
jgi:hypothetical protein